MRFYAFLNEYRVEYGPAGRGVAKSLPIIWIYINTFPKQGLIWCDTKGNVYQNDKKIAKMDNYGYNSTHKNLMAAAHDTLGFTGNLRDNVDNIVDADINPRGRIVGDTIYLYSSFDKNISKKAIEAIYEYIPD
jgi:hypothetical protein